MDKLTLNGTFSVAEAQEAHALSRSATTRIANFLGVCFLSVLAIAAICVGSWNILARDEYALVIPCLITVFLAIGGIAITRLKQRIDQAKLDDMRSNQKGLFVAAKWELTETGVRVVSDTGTANVKWDAFRGCRIGTDAMILFQKQPPRIYNILGRSQVGSDEMWEAAVALVSDKMPVV